MKAARVTSTGPKKRYPNLWLICVLLGGAALTACNGTSSPASGTPSSGGVMTSKSDATRLLEQGTFGPTAQDIAHVQGVGTEAYLSEQFALPAGGYPGFAYYTHTPGVSCQYDPTAPTGPASLCARDHYTLFQVQRLFFTNALTGADQLRQRVAFALSQIFVVSGTDIYEAYGMAAYQNMLLNDAFGNFRDLLTDATLNPAMGNYLDMVNNDKPNPSLGTEPNENYARELMQLFSIGVNKLNLDGSEQKDVKGQPIPTYDQGVVEGYAHLFTGWTYAPRPGVTSKWTNPINYEGNMVLFALHHDTAAKLILGGKIIPAGQTPQQDLKDGLDAIFNHPNVGPFIGRQLIQHLVTSNPSPGYVARVATVFNDNGQGVRGDLRAVVRAVLIDPEARGDSKSDAAYGHLREPALTMTSLLRSLGGQSDGVYLRGQAIAMGQNIFIPATVFNYYPPDYQVPGLVAGTHDLAPEFGIQDTTTTLTRANFVYRLVYGNGVAPDPTVSGSIGTQLDLTTLQAYASDADALVEQLNQRLMHGALTGGAHTTIAGAVNAVASSDLTQRTFMAMYLLASSLQYQVER